MASQLKSGAPTYGLMYELYVIAAVVVGGTSLSGGEGRILGTLIGAFIIAVIQNGMNLTNVESYTQKVVLGLVILGAVLLDRLKQRGWRRVRRRRARGGRGMRGERLWRRDPGDDDPGRLVVAGAGARADDARAAAPRAGRRRHRRTSTPSGAGRSARRSTSTSRTRCATTSRCSRSTPTTRFSFEGAFRYMLAKEYYPEEYARLKGYIADGRWRVAGSWVDAVDINIPSPESLIRQTLLRQRLLPARVRQDQPRRPPARLLRLRLRAAHHRGALRPARLLHAEADLGLRVRRAVRRRPLGGGRRLDARRRAQPRRLRVAASRPT